MGNTLIDAFIVFIVTLFAFYIIEITFGAAYDQFFNQMMSIAVDNPEVTSKILNLAKQFHRVILVIIIATALWVVRTVVVRMSYTRQMDNQW